MTNRFVALALLIVGLGSWFIPGFNGIFFETADVSAGDGRIVGAIFTVGAAIVWFQRP